MDPYEIIIIEDSPPSSPVPTSMSNTLTNDMINDVDLKNKSDFSTPNETMAWSQFTSQYISTTMNSVRTNNGKLVNDTKCTAVQNIVYSRETAVSNNHAHTQTKKNNFHRQYHAPFSLYNENCQYPSYDYYSSTVYQQNYTSSLEVMNNCYSEHKSNATLPTSDGQTNNDNYLYYNGHIQAPFRLSQNLKTYNSEYQDNIYGDATFNKENIELSDTEQEEFIDVNAYLADSSKNVNLASIVRLNSNNAKTKLQPSISSTTKENRKTMNSGLPFLKEDRAINMTKVILNGQSNTPLNLSKTKEISAYVAEDSDDSDIIFVAEYKQEVMAPEIVSSNNFKKGNNKAIEMEIKLELENPETCPEEETVSDKEAKKVSAAPRRNPNRQVRTAQKCAKIVYEDTWIPKSKSRKVKNKIKKKNVAVEKDMRRSLRQMTNCGAIHCPPSPITEKHFRDWPVEGMHERPEYNPATKSIEPFDSHIRNISKSNTSTYMSCVKENPTRNKNEDGALAQLCHEMLHHVLAYVATVKAMKQQEVAEKKLKDISNSSKTDFLTNLALNKQDSFDERVCRVFKDVVRGINSKRRVSDSEMIDLRNLIENSILLYCFTNNVAQSRVAKYIASIKPSDIMKFSNESFGLPSA